MNLLEKIKSTLSTKDAQKASHDYSLTVQMFIDEMQREKAMICMDKLCLNMKKQMRKKKHVNV